MPTVEQIKKLEAMRYNEVKPTESEAQKNKLKKKIQDGEYIATLKRDGFWYRYIKDKNENSILQSRTISRKTGEFTEKQDRVPHIMEELNKLPKETVILGEICYPKEMVEMISSDVTKVMGSDAPKAIKRQVNQKLHYAMFDLLAYDGVDYSEKPYEQRIEKLLQIKKDFDLQSFIEFPELITKDIEEQIGQWLSEGYEGAVLMHRGSKYSFGKRPKWVSVKYKQFLQKDEDFVICGFTQPIREYTGKYESDWYYWENKRTKEIVEGHYFGQQNYEAVTTNYAENLIGGFEIGLYKKNGKLVKVGKVANLTDKIRREATKNPEKFLNRVVKINAMAVDHEKRSLRHPKLIGFHDGKDAKECIYEEVFQ